jgi:hypothetical protein
MAVAVDEQSNSYVAGSFTGAGSAGQTDLFITKLDGNAQVIWKRTAGGAGAEEARGAAVSAAGEVYVTGTFSSTGDFDPGPGRTELTSAGDSDVFLLHLNPQGELVWARRLGGKLRDKGRGVAVGKDAIWVTGTFEGGWEGLESAGKSDAFVAKLDLEGHTLWARRIGGAREDEGCGVAAGRNGEVWVAGTFRESPSLAPEGGGLDFASAGHQDVFLLRLDAAGRLLWSGRIGGEQDDVCEGIAATVSGGAAVIGEFAKTADIDPTPGVLSVASHGSTDAFLTRVDGNGRLVWALGFGESGPDSGTAVAGDRNGSVYAVGHLDRPSRLGGSLAWAAEYSDSSHRAWSVGLQATGGLDARAIAVDPQGVPTVVGSFKGETKELREAGASRVQGFGKSDAFAWRLLPPSQ